MITVSTDIQFLKGVGEKRAVVLKKKGIDTVGALLHYYPRKYIDWTDISPICSAPLFQNVCVKAKILSIEAQKKRSGITLYSIVAEDSSAELSVILWGQKYLAESLRVGREYLFYGKITGGFLYRQMSSPKIVPVSYNLIEPIYPASKDISSKQIKNLIKNAVSSVEIEETLSQEITERNGLCSLKFAIQNIHFPNSREAFFSAQ